MTMPSLARTLFPDLAAHGGTGADSDPCERWITEETARLRAGAFAPELATFPAGSDHAALAAAFAVASDLAARSTGRAPEPEDFLAAGISPLTPSAATSAAAAPPAELLPVVAPHGLGAAGWERLFRTASTPLVPALALSTEVRRWFAALDQPHPAPAPTVRTRSTAGTVTWTLRWIPAGDAPPVRGSAVRAAAPVEHPSLPEMLTLQFLRVARGAAPADHAAFTWLAGELPDPRFAARHGYDRATHTIRLSTRERTDQGAHVGCRPSLAAPLAAAVPATATVPATAPRAA